MTAAARREERPSLRRESASQPAFAAAEDACRRVAADIRAASFSVLAVAAGAERRLEPIGGETPCGPAGFLGRFDAEAARHALASSAPFWWEGPKPLPPGSTLRRLPFAARGDFPGLAEPGLGFPCAAARGVCGVVLFWGERIGFEAERLFDLHARLFDAFGVLAARPAGLRNRPGLSKREIECLRLAAKGLTSEEIAASLALSVHTANQHLAAATAKLDAVNRMQAVGKALRLGVID